MDLLFGIRVFDAVALGASLSIESAVVDCSLCDIDGLMLKVTPAAGNADVKVQIALSSDGGTTFNNYTDQDSITDSTLADYATTPNDEHKLLVPRNRHLKIKVTNLVATAATVYGKLIGQEVG